MSTRIVFMGSPDFAAPSLKALFAAFDVVGVVTQPDRPKGRGKKLTAPPVKILAQSLGLNVFQPVSLKDPDAVQTITSWKPDMIVVAAFGQILRQSMLDLPPLGCLNVHPSLLPRWRGASPIQTALLSGDDVTGVTIMRLVRELDAGPIFDQVEIKIEAEDTGGTLTAKLAQSGADLLVDVIRRYGNGELKAVEQQHEKATFSSRLEKADGELDFSQPIKMLERKVRAFNPVPGAYMQWQGEYLKIHKAHIDEGNPCQPSTRSVIGGFPAVYTQNGWLVLDEVQPAGKKNMTGDVFLRGARSWENTEMS